MNIFWITSRHAPDRGGMAGSSARIVNSLRERGHNVTVLHLSGNHELHDPMSRNLVIIPCRDSLAEPERIFWQYRKIMENSLIAGFGGNEAGYLAVLWAKWLGRKSMVLFRGNDFEKQMHDVRRSYAAHFILENADYIGAVSMEMADRIRTLRRKPVVYTPNGIDLSEWGFLKRDSGEAVKWKMENMAGDLPVVAMFGELKAKKNFEAAYSLFTSYNFRERAHLLTVGSLSGDIGKFYDAGKSDFWKHVPFHEREELPVFYALADVVFIPSLYDGMPNVLLEAMALGRVVAASRAGAIPDVIKDGESGFLFEAMDLDDAARTLSRALDMDAQGRKAMGEAARKRMSEDFTPDKEIDIIEEMIISTRGNIN